MAVGVAGEAEEGGLAEAERTGVYYSSEEIFGELKGMLEAKRAEKRSK